MAAVRTETLIDAPAAQAWGMLAAVGQAHRAFAPVLSDCRMESENLRVVTFANGLCVREEIIDSNAALRRLSYRAQGGSFDHHNASFEITPIDAGSCRFVWTSDVLPDDAAARVRPLMEAGTAAFARNCSTG